MIRGGAFGSWNDFVDKPCLGSCNGGAIDTGVCSCKSFPWGARAGDRCEDEKLGAEVNGLLGTGDMGKCVSGGREELAWELA